MSALPRSLVDQVEGWIAEDPDPLTRQQLSATLALARRADQGAVTELLDAFSGALQFGTAGLRGALGPGPNRMNRVVVSRAAAGLAAYLLERGLAGRPVVIGFDARHNSDVFARDTAAILAGAGLAALLCPRPLPTPVVAAAIRTYQAAAAVVVTASHNPSQDNGYKVYLGDGAQIVPPADSDIAQRIAAVGPMAGIPRSADYTVLGENVVTTYLDRVTQLPRLGGPRDIRVAYTAMHGVGSPLVRAALTGAGFPQPLAVAAQDDPDPDFPTVAFPNPEEPGAMDLALALAGEQDVDLVLANDPDADRCAVGIPVRPGGGAESGRGAFRMLSGDEVGWLLGWWIVQRGLLAGRPITGTFANSIVSSQLLASIAGSAGLGFRETLTGFKWIARAADDLVFGYEEALGYCVDPGWVRDKDGISAALLMAELVAQLKAWGRTVPDVLDELAIAHGVHATCQVSLRFTELREIPALMADLRRDRPRSLGGLLVQRFTDLAAGSADLPATDGLRFDLGGGGGVAAARVIVRPSGTEPKVKAYLEVKAQAGDDLGAARAAASDALDRLSQAVRTRLAAPSAGQVRG